MTAPVCKLGHVALATPDLDRSLHFFTELLGLDVVGEHEGSVYLRAWGEIDHHSLVLREGKTGIDHFAFRASGPEQLDALANAVGDVERVPKGTELGQGDAIRFTSPSGHPYEVYWEMERGRQDSGLINQPGRAYLRGSSPRRLDHINVSCTDVGGAEQFLSEQLGFKRREFVQPRNGPLLATWMSVTSQVHDIAVTWDQVHDGRLHHISYIHNDVGDLLRGAEIMRDAGVQIDLPPGRHGISQAMFCYVHDPGSGHRVELFAGGYHIFDPDWEPVEWNEDNIATGMVWWGPDFVPGAGGPMDVTTPC